MFAREGEVRGPIAPTRARTHAPYAPYGVPTYGGPAVIGKAITRPTEPIGPDWIGSPAPPASTRQ